MSSIALSIIIPSYASMSENKPGERARAARAFRIERLCASLRSQKSVSDWEALIVSNPPDPGLERLLRRLEAPFRYLSTNEIGANSARNLGFAASRGAIALFLDDDCSADDPEFLRRHLELHTRNPSVSAFGGSYRLPSDAGRFARAYHQKQIEWLTGAVLPSARADWIPGGNASFKREALSREKFDPSFRFGGTETELILRMASQGYEIRFVPELEVTHRIDRMGWAGLARKGFAQGAGDRRIRARGLKAQALSRPRRGSLPSPKARRALTWLYDASYRAGGRRGDGENPGRTPSSLTLALAVALELLRQLGRLRHTPHVGVAFNRIRASIEMDRRND